MGLSLGFLSCAVGLCFCFVPVLSCLDHCSSVVKFEGGEPDSSSLVFFLNITLATQGLLCFHRNCKSFCSNFVKNVIDKLRGIALNM